MPITTYSRDEMEQHLISAYGGEIATASISLRFTSDVVGGQPATEAGIRAFCQHHLKLDGDNLEEAIVRIMTGEVRKDTGEDEVKEVESYGLKVLRRTPSMVAYIGTWQVRAMLKQSASRLGLFQQKGKVGSKGDLSEAMEVKPQNESALAGSQEICIVDGDGTPHTSRVYRKFMGSVSGPSGRMSIVHDSEVALAGSRIHFSVKWPTKKITPDNMAAILKLGENIGLGSVKSLECGRFYIEKLEIYQEDKPKTKLSVQ